MQTALHPFTPFGLVKLKSFPTCSCHLNNTANTLTSQFSPGRYKLLHFKLSIAVKLHPNSLTISIQIIHTSKRTPTVPLVNRDPFSCSEPTIICLRRPKGWRKNEDCLISSHMTTRSSSRREGNNFHTRSVVDA